MKKLVLSWTLSSSQSSTFVMELFLITTGISTNKFSYVNLLSLNISAVNSLSSLYSLNAATDSLKALILRLPSFVFNGSEEGIIVISEVFKILVIYNTRNIDFKRLYNADISYPSVSI